jgi:cardiolipin synthase A/B
MKLRFRLWPVLGLALVPGSRLRAAGLTLFETPRDGEAPVIQAIGLARHEVEVEVYELTDPDVENALIQARRAGRRVRVILNTRANGGSDPNRGAFDRLRAAGVEVRRSPPYFTFTHEKAILVDPGRTGQEAVIMTLNLSPSYMGKPGRYGFSLNFGVVDPSVSDVAAIAAIFQDDWTDAGFGKAVLPAGSDLVVSPVNSRDALLGQIRGARKSFHFFAQELFDPQVVAALAADARRGVEVRGLVAGNFAENRRTGDAIDQAGGRVRILEVPYEHAKAAIADGTLVYIGSVNYSTNSIERNRELGILTSQPGIAAQMEAEFARFWKLGRAWPAANL